MWWWWWWSASCLDTTPPPASGIGYLPPSLRHTLLHTPSLSWLIHPYSMPLHSLTPCLTSLFITSLKPTLLPVLHSLLTVSCPSHSASQPLPASHSFHHPPPHNTSAHFLLHNPLTLWLTLPDSSGCCESRSELNILFFCHPTRLCVALGRIYAIYTHRPRKHTWPLTVLHSLSYVNGWKLFCCVIRATHSSFWVLRKLYGLRKCGLLVPLKCTTKQIPYSHTWIPICFFFWE